MTDKSTRERILDTAARHFGRNGYGHTSMESIARDVGISKPAIYHHFRSKDAIFHALVERVIGEAEARFAEVRDRHLSLPDLIEQVISARLEMSKEHPDWLRFILRLDLRSEELPGIDALVQMHNEFHRKEEALVADHLGDWKMREGVTIAEFVQFAHEILFAFIARSVLDYGPEIVHSPLYRVMPFRETRPEREPQPIEFVDLTRAPHPRIHPSAPEDYLSAPESSTRNPLKSRRSPERSGGTRRGRSRNGDRGRTPHWGPIRRWFSA